MKRFAIFPALVLGALLLAATAAFAGTVGVNDTGHFFSPQAIKRADGVIRDIIRRHPGDGVLIETFNALPPGRDLRRFAIARADHANPGGLYVIIVRKGGEVGVLPSGHVRALLGDGFAGRLRRSLTAGLRQGHAHFDAALLAAVHGVQGALDSAPAAGGRVGGPTLLGGATRGGLLGSFWGWLALGLGLWLVVGMVRALMMRRRGPAGFGGMRPGYGRGMGQGGYGGYGRFGGGWGSSILGGMLGAVAGNWLFDRFFEGGGYGMGPGAGGLGTRDAFADNQAGGYGDGSFGNAGADFDGGGAAAGGAGPGTWNDGGDADFGGGDPSAGSFGGDPGGGFGGADFGGGDFGGGDFGGGDFGGGDFGGGDDFI